MKDVQESETRKAREGTKFERESRIEVELMKLLN